MLVPFADALRLPPTTYWAVSFRAVSAISFLVFGSSTERPITRNVENLAIAPTRCSVKIEAMSSYLRSPVLFASGWIRTVGPLENIGLIVKSFGKEGAAV